MHCVMLRQWDKFEYCCGFVRWAYSSDPLFFLTSHIGYVIVCLKASRGSIDPSKQGLCSLLQIHEFGKKAGRCCVFLFPHTVLCKP